DRDLHRDHVATLRLGRGVVRLAELHDVYAVLAQCGSNGRGGVRQTSLDLELDQAGNLLLGGCHSWVLFVSSAAGRRMVAVVRSRLLECTTTRREVRRSTL